MIRRVAAVVIGAAVLVLGVLGQEPGARRVMVGIYTATAIAGAGIGWWRLETENPLTWKRVTVSAIVGSGVAGLVLGLFEWRMVNTLGDGMGIGLFVGLVLSGINGTFRKTADDRETSDAES